MLENEIGTHQLSETNLYELCSKAHCIDFSRHWFPSDETNHIQWSNQVLPCKFACWFAKNWSFSLLLPPHGSSLAHGQIRPVTIIRAATVVTLKRVPPDISGGKPHFWKVNHLHDAQIWSDSVLPCFYFCFAENAKQQFGDEWCFWRTQRKWYKYRDKATHLMQPLVISFMACWKSIPPKFDDFPTEENLHGWALGVSQPAQPVLFPPGLGTTAASLQPVLREKYIPIIFLW